MQSADVVLKTDIDPQAFYRALGVFFVLLAALALSWGAAVGTSVDTRVRADSVQYMRYAWNMKYAGVYSRGNEAIAGNTAPRPDAFRTPGYPLFLLPFMERAPDRDFVILVRQVQAFFFVVVVGLAFLLFRQFMPYGPSLAAAALTAISPHLVSSTVYLLTEIMFALFVVASLLGAAWLIRRPRVWLGVITGLLVGYGALVRPSLLYFPLLLLPLVWFHVARHSRGRVIAAFFAGFLVATCAWGARNLNAIGEWSDGSLAAMSLQHGTYPAMMYQDDPETYGVAYRADPNSAEASRSIGAVLQELSRKASEDPGRYLYWYAIGKPLMLWQWHLLSDTGDIFVYPVDQSPYYRLAPFQATHAFMKAIHWPLVALGALASALVFLTPLTRWLGDERAAAARVVGLSLVYFTALHMVVAPYPRYSIPLRPELYGMAVFCLFLGWRVLRSRVQTAPVE